MTEEIRDNSQRSKDIIIVFFIALCINIVIILLTIYQSYTLNNYDFSQSDLSTIEWLDVVVPIAYYVRLTTYLVTIVLFLRWFKRAYGNLVRYNLPMKHSENIAIWGFFIPLINLYHPYQTGKEIYLKTQYAIKKHNSIYRVDKDTSFVAVWWILYIVNNVFSRFASKELEVASDIPSFIDANGYVIISNGISILAIVAVLYFIYKVKKVETLFRETNMSVSEIDEIGKVIE